MKEKNYIKRFVGGLRILREMTYFDYKVDVEFDYVTQIERTGRDKFPMLVQHISL